jgi:hypothetical protein
LIILLNVKRPSESSGIINIALPEELDTSLLFIVTI